MKTPFVFLLILVGCAVPRPVIDSHSLLDARLSSLESSLFELRSDLERMRRRVERSQVTLSDGPRKMKKVSEIPIRKITPELATEAPTEVVADSKFEGLSLYRRALTLLKDKKPEAAISSLRQFLDENPDHVYADRAQYLIAEAYFQNQEYGLVLAATLLLETKYPYSFRLGDACYYRALALLQMGEKARGTERLWEILRRFPTEKVAEKATQKLGELGEKRTKNEVPLLPSVRS